MSTEPSTLNLRLHPGGLGVYGAALQGDTVVHLDILPPAYLWADDTPPHADPTRWTIYADGSLIGRIEREEDVGPALLPLLAGRPSAFARARGGSQNTESDR